MNQYQAKVLAALQGKGKMPYADVLQETGPIGFEHVAALREAGKLDYIVEFHDGKPAIQVWEVSQ
jgi:hypothetical protein